MPFKEQQPSNNATNNPLDKDSNYGRLDIIDIIFSNRNKKYGAYYLRKQYNHHLRIGVLLTFSIFLLIIAFPYMTDFLGYSTWFKPQKEEELNIIPINIDNQIKPLLPPPPKEKPKPPKEKPKTQPKKDKPPTPKKELNPNDQLPINPTPQPPIPNPNDNNNALQNLSAPAKNEDEKGQNDNKEVADNGKSTKVDTSAVYFKVDEMPMFPGGMTALQKYIYNNVRYPPIAKKDTIEGIVTASFIVQQDGTITDVNILDAPPNCNECRGQVIKNLYKMPDWVPGKRNGKLVKVRCLIQINFELGE